MEFDINKLNNLRIHELRDLARNVGVKSPTSLKKEKIIEKILLILSGENEPYVNVTKQGRPAKSQHKIGEIVDIFLPKNDAFNQMNAGGDYVVKSDEGFEFFANAPEVDYNNSKVKGEKVAGYLDVLKSGYGVVRINCCMPSGADVFLHLYSIKTYNLQTGDYLEGEAKLIQTDRPRVMFKIDKVNGLDIDHLPQERVLFNNLPYLPLKNEISINLSHEITGGEKLYEGGRYLFLGKTLNMSMLSAAASDLKEKGYSVYIVNLNALPEEVDIKIKDAVFLNLDFNTSDSSAVTCVNLLIEKAKREVEQGNKAVFVFNKIASVLKAVSASESGVYSGELKLSTITRFKSFIMSAKNVSDSANLTLIMFENPTAQNIYNNFIEGELINFVNSVTYI